MSFYSIIFCFINIIAISSLLFSYILFPLYHYPPIQLCLVFLPFSLSFFFIFGPVFWLFLFICISFLLPFNSLIFLALYLSDMFVFLLCFIDFSSIDFYFSLPFVFYFIILFFSSFSPPFLLSSISSPFSFFRIFLSYFTLLLFFICSFFPFHHNFCIFLPLFSPILSYLSHLGFFIFYIFVFFLFFPIFTAPHLSNTSLQEVYSNGDMCNFLFNLPQLSDLAIGSIIMLIALVILSASLILVVKVLRSLLEGPVAEFLKKIINANIPCCPFLTGYVAIVLGAVLTFAVQSSSVFTSTITPLVGAGLIEVERMYPLILGSNIGTTSTALLAAFASGKQDPLQIALCHFFFNIFGIALFYPIPMARIPLVLCRILGRTTARYRWFSLLYLFTMFFIIPGAVLALSLAGTIPFAIIITILTVLFTFIILINILQSKHPKVLPERLRNWHFLPKWLRSLEPYDHIVLKILSKMCRCCPGFLEKLNRGMDESNLSMEMGQSGKQGHANMGLDTTHDDNMVQTLSNNHQS